MIHGYYINLDTRVDRKTHIENLKLKYPFFSNVERFEAIKNENGAIGCSLSHIKALTELSNKNHKYYLLIEDDFFIFDDANFNDFVKSFEEIKDNNNWDLITLTPRGSTQTKNYINGFHKIIHTQTTTGYIVKHEFIDELLKYYKNGVIGLMRNPNNTAMPNLDALDQCWKPLQEKSNFIYFNKIYGGQLHCYSDIETQVVDYNARFKAQIHD